MLIAVLLLLACCLQPFAQLKPELATAAPDHAVLTSCEAAVPYADQLSEENLRSLLQVLAHDSLEGRETGTEGQRKAADFIAAYFRNLGLPAIGDPDPLTGQPTFFQYISFTSERWMRDSILLETNGRTWGFLRDYYAFPSENANREERRTSEVIFLGYGIDDERYNDYAGVDVRGKTLLIYAGEPQNPSGVSWLTGTTGRSRWTTEYQLKLEAAHRHGAETVLIIDPSIQSSIATNRFGLLGGKMEMGPGGQAEGRFANHFFISSTVAREIVGEQYEAFVAARDQINQTGVPTHLTLQAEVRTRMPIERNQLTGSNVLGYVEGLDPARKHEVVVVSAHYDHLGRRGQSIFNGADDNGSGTATVMELARVFAQARKDGVGPQRSILFLLVSGEEKGLLGSEYYTNHPVFPLENTVADVNVDMIGRTDKNHPDDPNYVYVIGADRLSTMLHKINEAANQQYVQLYLDYTYNAESDPNRFYYRSDHYNFAKNGIPSVFFFSGTHADYHRPTDTVDKIMFPKMLRIARLIFFTTWELANRPDRIRVDVPQKD